MMEDGRPLASDHDKAKPSVASTSMYHGRAKEVHRAPPRSMPGVRRTELPQLLGVLHGRTGGSSLLFEHEEGRWSGWRHMDEHLRHLGPAARRAPLSHRLLAAGHGSRVQYRMPRPTALGRLKSAEGEVNYPHPIPPHMVLHSEICRDRLRLRKGVWPASFLSPALFLLCSALSPPLYNRAPSRTCPQPTWRTCATALATQST